jgi:hypothetical protein
VHPPFIMTRSSSAPWRVAALLVPAACGGAPAPPTLEPTPTVAAPAPTQPAATIDLPATPALPKSNGVPQNVLVERISQVHIEGQDLAPRDILDPLTVDVFKMVFRPGAGPSVDFPGCRASVALTFSNAGVRLITVGFCPDGPVALFRELGARRLGQEEAARFLEFAAAPEDHRCWSDCLTTGVCTPRDDECVATNDADCQRSAFCKMAGQCKNVGDRCEQGASGACAQSLNCKSFGLCAMRGNQCGSTDPRHCLASDHCAGHGYCELGPKGCRIGSDLDCAKSKACKTHGLCAIVESKGLHSCVATPEGCAKSDLCRVNQKCSAVPNTSATDIEFSDFGYTTSLTPATICK